MDSDTVQKIAIEVAKHLPTLAWAALVIQVVLTVAAAAAGAIFGEYFGTRGKNHATKADFESLKDQLRANTELVETIKSEVSQRDWAKREWANLRRLKLEQLLEQVDDRDHYRDLIRTNALGGTQ
jgi:ABC-type phosphate/phosphonate transport system permease subunit